MRLAVDLLFAVLWSVALFLVLDVAARRIFPIARQRVIAAGVAAVAFLIGGIAVPLRHPGPPPDGTQNAAASPAPVPTARDVSASCHAGSTTSLARNGTGSLDGAADSETHSPIAPGAIVAKGRGITFLGWAANGDRSAPAAAVCLDLDGSIVAEASATYGQLRPDVAVAYKSPRLQLTGFAVTVSPNRLTEGPHVVRIAVVDGNGTLTDLPQQRRFTVR